MTVNNIPRKWECIADQLRKLNAPKKVINAAVEIDNAMVQLRLGRNTNDWERYWKQKLNKEGSYSLRIIDLFHLIINEATCTACVDSDGECINCKLGEVNNCTPRSKHADLYFTIVKVWVENKLKRNKDELH